MTKNRFKWSAMTVAFVAVSLATGVAVAADEIETTTNGQCNYPVSQAQALAFDSNGVAEVHGMIFNGANPCAVPQGRDVDFYKFTANAGDDFNIAIQNAYDDAKGYTWTVIWVFGPNGGDMYYPWSYAILGPSDGTYYNKNPAIPKFNAQEAGTYYIGVSSYPGLFMNVDQLWTYDTYYYPMSPPAPTEGMYTLVVKGAKPPVLQISMLVEPGKRNVTVLDASSVKDPWALRGKAKGSLPVALLSSKEKNFNALDIDQSTLHFGSKGDEESLIKCSNGRGFDANHDGLPDLLCHFDMTKANFALADNEAYVTGKTTDGTAFEGNAWMHVVTVGLEKGPK